jgi:hypothetical protein
LAAVCWSSLAFVISSSSLFVISDSGFFRLFIMSRVSSNDSLLLLFDLRLISRALPAAATLPLLVNVEVWVSRVFANLLWFARECDFLIPLFPVEGCGLFLLGRDPRPFSLLLFVLIPSRVIRGRDCWGLILPWPPQHRRWPVEGTPVELSQGCCSGLVPSPR